MVYAKLLNLNKLLKAAAEDIDVYTDVENELDECV